MDLKKIFLILAFAMVSVIALLYGIDPSWFARSFLGVTDLTLDFAHKGRTRASSSWPNLA